MSRSSSKGVGNNAGKPVALKRIWGANDQATRARADVASRQITLITKNKLQR